MFYLEILEAIEEQIKSMIFQTESKKWCCSSCGKETYLKTDMFRHVESNHIENHPGFSCEYCGHILKSSNAYRVHVNQKHRTKK